MSATLSTHVLDTAVGRPAAGLAVTHHRHDGTAWVHGGDHTTDDDGRVPRFAVEPGTHRLTFATGAHLGPEAFYPEVTVVFRVTSGHHHVPLLISPFGYSTYRGS
ncbi:hydroxyisourate hydrolase [Actinokineospora bangkokensis]|uniref:5-hydroxyisourate hydrolase n=1 Tax=Actinokineospora bangkokensis TaxID=1193682 RepID=A0A1Q9LSL4_9PSEU|nr:hydroxyisourate hydrolase [Actinokineospora bangkokensis]OLR95025.1 hydroxyisourate hydrolase [Actinokineospora bangkokensis]